MSLFLEDYHPGDVIDLGTHHFTADAIKAFAALYDPQTFHLDEAAARSSVFGALSASGWHTAAVWMKLMVANELKLTQAIVARGDTPGRLGPSPGFSEMRFLKPVHAGDTIAYTTSVRTTEPWPGRPKWGLLVSDNAGVNQRGEAVFTFIGRVLVERRTPLA